MRKYIAFEGLDLSGKTTIINNIKSILKRGIRIEILVWLSGG